MTTRTQSGFSLVELMVAMTVTLIVSAAIYGLLTSGSEAFRREPEIADRQQNIRVAMDVIARDVFNAGAALPAFSQVFTWADPAGGLCAGADGLNGCGDLGTMGPGAAADRAPGDGGDPSLNSDVIELVSTSENCPPRTVCLGSAGSPGTLMTREPVGACLDPPGFTLIANNEAFSIQPTVSTAAGDCGGAGDNGAVELGAVVPPWAPTLAIPANPTPFLYAARVVRYRIAPSTDPMDNSPALWRSNTGRFASDGTAVAEPGDASFPDLASPWELV
jgi:prepilin-type N-terminal cleavage/methylation domain-containing protein